MEVNVTPVSGSKARKKEKCPDKWKRQIEKKQRYSSVNPPTRHPCNHNTSKLKCKTLKMSQIMAFHKKFYNTKIKLEQDSIILKCCKPVKVKTRRTVNLKQKRTDFTTRYSIYDCESKTFILVCQKTFLGILNIKKYRVQYVMKTFFNKGIGPKENRGGDHKSHLFNDKRQAVKDFMNSLKCSEPHYCRGSTHSRKYLPSDLNINKLYRMFTEKTLNFNVKKSYFRTVFNQCYNLGFGSPRTDVCSICTEFAEKLKSEQNVEKRNGLLIDQRVHKLRANAFYTLLKEKKIGMKTFSFDCEKNLPLPKVPDQMCYYARQLYLHNFTIVEGSSQDPMRPDNVFAYTWTENLFGKGSNEIASAVYDRLNKTDLTGINHVRLVADGCGGQNKNSFMLGMLSKWILDKPSVKTVEIIFPVAGHSFMPPDRIFGKIEQEIRKREVIVLPEEYINIIKNYATVTSLNEIDIFDWKTAVQNIMKSTDKLPFKIKLCKRFFIKRSKKIGNALVRAEIYYKSDMASYVNVNKKYKMTNMINPTAIAPGTRKVKPAKLKDVRKLLLKHYGNDWMNLPLLKYYAEQFTELPPFICDDNEENSDEEITDEQNVYCERNEEPPTLQV